METKLESTGHEEEGSGFTWAANSTCYNRGTRTLGFCLNFLSIACHGLAERGPDIPGGLTTGSKAGVCELVLSP